MEKPTSGILACAGALQRLKDGNPYIDSHKGLPLSKITAGIVSVEAGFDRGYLKKSRKKHHALLAEIEFVRSNDTSANGNFLKRSGDARYRKDQFEALQRKFELALIQRDAVLSQNLLLYEKVRVLQLELAKLKTDSNQFSRF